MIREPLDWSELYARSLQCTDQDKEALMKVLDVHGVPGLVAHLREAALLLSPKEAPVPADGDITTALTHLAFWRMQGEPFGQHNPVHAAMLENISVHLRAQPESSFFSAEDRTMCAALTRDYHALAPSPAAWSQAFVLEGYTSFLGMDPQREAAASVVSWVVAQFRRFPSSQSCLLPGALLEQATSITGERTLWIRSHDAGNPLVTLALAEMEGDADEVRFAHPLLESPHTVYLPPASLRGSWVKEQRYHQYRSRGLGTGAALDAALEEGAPPSASAW